MSVELVSRREELVCRREETVCRREEATGASALHLQPFPYSRQEHETLS